MPQEGVKTAEELATQQREISISEFFEKNRHLLGYDNKIKALLIIVKEGVDNALDACDEARILPEIFVKLEELGKEKYRVIIRDNGPGILKEQIPKIFGTLLYGSKFHRLRQSRGAQGLGISCAVMYSQLTTGEPVEVLSSTGDGTTHRYKMKIDVKKNEAVVLETEDLKGQKWHGLQITFICEGIYREHKQSVLEYMKETAIGNPYANLVFESPTGRLEFKRSTEQLPPEPKQIPPHIKGVEIGVMTRLLNNTAARSLETFFTTEFTRIGKTSADEICKAAGLDSKISPRRIEDRDIVKIVEAVKIIKLPNPPTDILSPLGEKLVEGGLKKELNPDFVASISRPPAVYRGFPFIIEAGIAYGGSVTEPGIMRFANRVPLLYQQGDCAVTKSATSVDWKRYGIESDKLPTGPVVVFVHICSVWVPFTSESKEAVASYPIIMKEVKLALQEVARKLSLYLSGIRKAEYQAERLKTFEKYAEETAKAVEELTGESAKKIRELIEKVVKEKAGELEVMEAAEEAKLAEAKKKKDENETVKEYGDIDDEE